MRINHKRLLSRLSDLAAVGALPGGGVQRLAFSEEDLAGREFVAGHLRAIGLAPRIDAVGNLFAFRPALTPHSAPPVLLGSHTDTVGNAGRFDGALGVLAALEVLETLHENGVETGRPVGLASFVNEEGVRFQPDMMGSLFLRGDLSTDAVRAAVDAEGRTIGSCLDDLAMAGDFDLRETPLSAFLELHIEQGPVLEETGRSVGAVTGVQGLRWLAVRFRGSANHAGTTPMAGRKDAMVAAAALATAVRVLTTETAGLRGTVGRLEAQPNLVNVIPAAVRMTVDLRHPDQSVLDASAERVRELAEAAARSEALEVEIAEAASAPAVSFAPAVVDAVREAIAHLGYPQAELISGAGHDAQILADHCPSGMIFIRSRDGVSHNPAEFSTDEDVVAGADVLLRAALTLAGQPPSTDV